VHDIDLQVFRLLALLLQGLHHPDSSLYAIIMILQLIGTGRGLHQRQKIPLASLKVPRILGVCPFVPCCLLSSFLLGIFCFLSFPVWPGPCPQLHVKKQISWLSIYFKGKAFTLCINWCLHRVQRKSNFLHVTRVD
jgi:hypothetical protein